MAAFALAGSAALTTEEARAYQSFFTPLFAKPTADPCAAQGIPASGGVVVRRQPPLQAGDIPREVLLLCSPAYTVPFSTLLADDAIWQYHLHHIGPTDGHMLEGNRDSLPWKPGLSTKNFPSYKGPGGNAVSWKQISLDSEAWATAQGLAVTVAAISGVVATPACASFLLGAIVAAAPCAAGLVLGSLAAGVLAVPAMINWISRYFQRNEAMNNGNWFTWSSGAGFFNGFGDVDQTWINPSLFSAADQARMRVGVVFSNVLLNQGPDFDLSRVGSAETETPQSRRLGALVRRLERSHGLTRTGSRRGERLFGGRRDDYLFAAAGHDSLFGRRGNDVLLQGARGNDRILGGPGNDNIDGHRGGDVLSGGPGNDQIVDFFGDTTVYTGRGRDLVAVRDGGGGDVVVCRGPGRKRILADPRDRIVGKVAGPAHTVGARGCPPGSRVITTGPLPRLGRGY